MELQLIGNKLVDAPGGGKGIDTVHPFQAIRPYLLYLDRQSQVDK